MWTKVDTVRIAKVPAELLHLMATYNTLPFSIGYLWNRITTKMFDIFRIITLKQQIVSQSDPVLIRAHLCYMLAPDKFKNGAQQTMKWPLISLQIVPIVVLASFIGGVASCILNSSGKYKSKIRGIKLTGKQSAEIELSRRDHSTDTGTRLHYHCIGIRAVNDDNSLVVTSSGHRPIWWGGCDIDLELTQCVAGTLLRKPITSTHVHLRGKKSKLGLDAWVIKLVKL